MLLKIPESPLEPVYLEAMARGWESKDVESQQELAEERRRLASAARPSPEELARRQEIESLKLSRTRVAADLERATHPRHRVQLEAALAHLDERLNMLQCSE